MLKRKEHLVASVFGPVFCTYNTPTARRWALCILDGVYCNGSHNKKQFFMHAQSLICYCYDWARRTSSVCAVSNEKKMTVNR